MIDIASGHPAIDRYLAERYEQVRGMSSRFAADAERRLAPGEKAIGIDRFDWPDAGIEGRFLANCAAHGLSPHSYVCWKADSREIAAADLRARLGARPARFVHVDGHHSRECLANDLELTHAVMHRDGLICLDDMLHPGYPLVVTTVFDYLARHPEMRLLAVIDREDIVAAPKFLICRGDAFVHYEQDLLREFSRFHFTLNADMETYFALVLTPRPRLAEVE